MVMVTAIFSSASSASNSSALMPIVVFCELFAAKSTPNERAKARRCAVRCVAETLPITLVSLSETPTAASIPARFATECVTPDPCRCCVARSRRRTYSMFRASETSMPAASATPSKDIDACVAPSPRIFDACASRSSPYVSFSASSSAIPNNR